MASNALYNQPHKVTPRFDVSDDVASNVEAMRLYGLVDDANYEDTLQKVTGEFNALGQFSVSSELFIALPQTQLPLSHRLDVLGGVTKAIHGNDHPEPYFYEELWVPSRRHGSYTNEMLGQLGPEYNGKAWVAHGRVVVPNNNNPQEPILHHLNMPYDSVYDRDVQETQLQALAKQKAAFEAEHPDANLNPLTARDVSFMALVRLVQGKQLPMEWGFMRDGTLPRTVVGGVSHIGGVRSVGSQLVLVASGGYACPVGGVGVSVGLNPA